MSAQTDEPVPAWPETTAGERLAACINYLNSFGLLADAQAQDQRVRLRRLVEGTFKRGRTGQKKTPPKEDQCSPTS